MSGDVLAAWAGAAVALLASGLATWQARKATLAANRSADADERAAAAAERALELAVQQAERYVADWRLSWSHDRRYLLANASQEIAYDVAVTAALRGNNLIVDEPPRRDLWPREALEFIAVRTRGTVEDVVAVTWRRQNGEVHEWQHPLPPVGQAGA